MIQKVAFATSDGFHVDLHFGQAAFLEIYHLHDPLVVGEPDERRRKETGKSIHGDRHTLTDLWSALSDCDALFVAKIGPAISNYFIHNGLRVFQTTESIEAILEAIKQWNEAEKGENNHARGI